MMPIVYNKYNVIMMKWYISLIAGIILSSCTMGQKQASEDPAIRPWDSNRSYWQYKGEHGADENQAYLAASEGDKYLIYFTQDDEVRLDLNGQQGEFDLRWISIEDVRWTSPQIVNGGGFLDLSPPKARNNFAVLVKK
jgi:hypothetical protein